MKDFNIPTESLDQAAHDRTKRRWPIRKGAAPYEAKIICGAERKRNEHKGRDLSRSSPHLLFATTVYSLN